MSKSGSKIGKLDPNMAVRDAGQGLLWYDIRALGVEGRAWDDTESDYDRLPARAARMVPAPVWELSHHSAGMGVRFITDSNTISARWKLRFQAEHLGMHHMPPTGVSGLDLYVQQGRQWRWAGLGIPTQFPSCSGTLLTNPKPGRHLYVLYLPLYNGVESVEIGIRPDAFLGKAPARTRRPVVFYGTSIVQGGCASRPGMAHTSLISRQLDVPVVNLGFSGNGTMETALAELIAGIDASVYVLDCLPNMDVAMVRERFEPFLRVLRGKRTRTPIVIMENVVYQNAYLCPATARALKEKNDAMRVVFKSLRGPVAKGLHYVGGDALLGRDWEATVDGVHPTDVGFLRLADALAPVLRRLLRAKQGRGSRSV